MHCTQLAMSPQWLIESLQPPLSMFRQAPMFQPIEASESLSGVDAQLASLPPQRLAILLCSLLAAFVIVPLAFESGQVTVTFPVIRPSSHFWSAFSLARANL